MTDGFSAISEPLLLNIQGRFLSKRKPPRVFLAALVLTNHDLLSSTARDPGFAVLAVKPLTNATAHPSPKMACKIASLTEPPYKNNKTGRLRVEIYNCLIV